MKFPESVPYVGRYAPSPSGALHLGNLRTALLSWLHARLNGGQFLLRMEDLDRARVVPGSDKQILADLYWLGLDWDGAVEYQSQRLHLYDKALKQLQSQQKLYPCFCSRKELRKIASAPHGKGKVYPGNCRHLSETQIRARAEQKPAATRFLVEQDEIQFVDLLQGRQIQNVADETGDFVVSRADGVIAYQLAVVVDDLEQGVSHVVRGADLLDSTARQLLLAKTLAPQQPAIQYCHVPLMLDNNGNRMAKRDGSDSLKQWQASGRSAAELIARFARELGFAIAADRLSAKELLNTLTIADFNQLK